MTHHSAPKRFLVLHDYGMGGSWWWVRAGSERQIRETFAEMEVIDPSSVNGIESWALDEVDVDAPTLPPGLSELRDRRDRQQGRPGFGALADRDVVHLRRRWEGEDADDQSMTYLLEVGADGRRLRQVEIADDGTAVRSGPDDWPLNSPVVDLFDPDLAGMEISRAHFDTAWTHARPEDRAD
jgi:hypothetical protein